MARHLLRSLQLILLLLHGGATSSFLLFRNGAAVSNAPKHLSVAWMPRARKVHRKIVMPPSSRSAVRSSRMQQLMQTQMQTDPFDVPRPDPSILISAKSPFEQKLWIAGISAGLFGGTFVLVSILTTLEGFAPDLFGFLGNLSTVPLGPM